MFELTFMFITQMTRRCWPLSRLDVDEMPPINMVIAAENMMEGKSDILFCCLNGLLGKYVPNALVVASNDPLNIRA
jgi:hypothetical protein